jgi:hypothetical protein
MIFVAVEKFDTVIWEHRRGTLVCDYKHNPGWSAYYEFFLERIAKALSQVLSGDRMKKKTVQK